MPQIREVKTCDRCRTYKRRCDLLKPTCSRCIQAGVQCSFEAATQAGQGRLLQEPERVLHPASGSGSGTRGAVLDGVKAAEVLISTSSSSELTDTAAPLQVPSGHHQKAHLSASPTGHGLVTPTASTDSPEPHAGPSAEASSFRAAPRVVRKRRRNCLSCLRCHRLKVKCDKELPCGRCKSSGNGRDCYYSYNKGPNGGKFPCPTTQAAGDDAKAVHATWQTHHRVRGSSHWRDLIAKVSLSET